MAKLSRRMVAQTIAEKLLQEPARSKHWVSLAAAYLVETKQASKVDQLVQDIAREVQSQSGLLLATVVSAHELSAELRKQVADSLAQATGAKSVSLDATVDPTLLAGYVARTPDHEINTSARYRLKQLRSLEASR